MQGYLGGNMLRKALLAAVTLALLPLVPAKAESLLFSVQSKYPYIVHIAFYSDNRNWEWPGDDKVYVLDDSRVHDYSLGCNSGEKICYGAWPKGTRKSYWGVGPDGNQSCRGCCYICNGGETGVIVLQD